LIFSIRAYGASFNYVDRTSDDTSHIEKVYHLKKSTLTFASSGVFNDRLCWL